MEKVLVTGADGFIGSHLVESLVARGQEVRALSQYNSFNDWGWLERVPCLGDIEVVTGDVRDQGFCRELVKGCDTVYHLAALIAIPYSYVAPESYLQTNVNGTLNICQAVRAAGARKLVHLSTSETYGTAQYVPIDEKHPMQPQSPYSASKIGADSIAMSFFHSFSVPLVVARPFNTYGPRQSARAVIPNIIAQIASGKKQIRLGDVRPTRDFTFVKDTCEALIQLSENSRAVGQTVNIGTNFEISIAQLFDEIKSLMNSDAEIEHDESRVRPEGSEVNRLWCDNSKLRELTGFAPATALRDGLRSTIDWFTSPANLSRYKVDRYNI